MSMAFSQAIRVCLEPAQDKLESTGLYFGVAAKRILEGFDSEEANDDDRRHHC